MKRLLVLAIALVLLAFLAPPVSATTPPTYYYSQQIFKLVRDATALDYEITAAKEVDLGNIGPAYLLNGLTDNGYWYQVGLSYNMANDPNNGYFGTGGWRVVVNNFDPSGNRIVSQSHYDTLYGVSVGDSIRMRLSISDSADNVHMNIHDDTNGFGQIYNYGAHGASTFTDQPTGDFTGLMTEWHHLSTGGYGAAEHMEYDTNDPQNLPAWMVINDFSLAPDGTQTTLANVTGPHVGPAQDTSVTLANQTDRYRTDESFRTKADAA